MHKSEANRASADDTSRTVLPTLAPGRRIGTRGHGAHPDRRRSAMVTAPAKAAPPDRRAPGTRSARRGWSLSMDVVSMHARAGGPAAGVPDERRERRLPARPGGPGLRTPGQGRMTAHTETAEPYESLYGGLGPRPLPRFRTRRSACVSTSWPLDAARFCRQMSRPHQERCEGDCCLVGLGGLAVAGVAMPRHCFKRLKQRSTTLCCLQSRLSKAGGHPPRLPRRSRVQTWSARSGMVCPTPRCLSQARTALGL